MIDTSVGSEVFHPHLACHRSLSPYTSDLITHNEHSHSRALAERLLRTREFLNPRINLNTEHEAMKVLIGQKVGTPRSCYICRRETTTVLATLKTEDFLYTCEVHLTDS